MTQAKDQGVKAGTKSTPRKKAEAEVAVPVAEGGKQVADNNIRVIYGVHSLPVPLVGMSVAFARQKLTKNLNIPTDAQAVVKPSSGRGTKLQKADEAKHILKQGDQLEFVKLAGEKGLR